MKMQEWAVWLPRFYILMILEQISLRKDKTISAKNLNFVSIKYTIMISKATIKKIHALEMRKYRRKEQLFVAEGPKLVGELCSAMKPVYLAALPEWIESNRPFLTGIEHDVVTPDELQKASLLKTPQQVIALFPLPEVDAGFEPGKGELMLMLDGVQDPGNLGTIARVADWFGIRNIICSLEIGRAHV